MLTGGQYAWIRQCLIGSPPDDIERQRDWERITEILELVPDFENLSSYFHDTVAEYVRVVDYACDHRRFFSTKGGRIGLGPINIEPGDKICVYYGGISIRTTD